VVFYGVHPNVKPDLPNLRSPVLGIYAERDTFASPESVHDLEEKLRTLGKSIETYIYPGTDHAFFHDARPGVYDAPAAADAWKKVIAFLNQNLAGE